MSEVGPLNAGHTLVVKNILVLLGELYRHGRGVEPDIFRFFSLLALDHQVG